MSEPFSPGTGDVCPLCLCRINAPESRSRDPKSGRWSHLFCLYRRNPN